MLSKNRIQHTAGDTKNWTLNYVPWSLPGEILSTIELAVSSGTIEVANAAIHLGRHVHFQITGGEAGETVTITATVTTSKTRIKIESLEVCVNAP